MGRVASLPTVPCLEGTLVVGDLHLDVFQPHGPEAFRTWCEGLDEVTRLVILGDLFEYWVGRHQLKVEGTSEVVAGIRVLVERGIPVEVLHGNRDYLLGEPFERASGATLHPFGFVAEPASRADGSPGERALMLHGDELCSADRAYQRLRGFVRSRPLVALQRSLPLPAQQALARTLRRSSSRSTAAKAPDQVRMVPETAQAQMGEAGVQTLVCGHAHRPLEQALGPARWLVVNAWGGPGDAVRLSNGRWSGSQSGYSPDAQ